jgi:hypothetical protein
MIDPRKTLWFDKLTIKTLGTRYDVAFLIAIKTALTHNPTIFS